MPTSFLYFFARALMARTASRLSSSCVEVITLEWSGVGREGGGGGGKCYTTTTMAKGLLFLINAPGLWFSMSDKGCLKAKKLTCSSVSL